MKKLQNRDMRMKETIKSKYIRTIFTGMLLIMLITPLPVLAADAEFRMMHGEQDAIVVGTIKEITEEGYLIEKSHVITCKAENTLNRQLSAEKVPDELLIEEVKYRFSYHGKSYPEVGDHIVISVDKYGKIWKQEWMAFEVSSTDISTLEVLMPEDMTSDAYAWQVFIRSDGEKVNFAYEGEILYLDGEKIFDRIEHLKSVKAFESENESKTVMDTEAQQEKSNKEEPDTLQSAENAEVLTEEEYHIEEFQADDKSISVTIIGGADGPTSIFLAGKLGTGFKVMVALIIIVPVVIVALIIWQIKRRKSSGQKSA